MSATFSVSDDGIFRAIFGHESSTRFLTGLVNAVLRNAGEAPIRALEIKNPFQVKDLADQKEPVLDIKAQDDHGAWFDVEIQIASHENFRERILYYWSRTYSQELQEGTTYNDLCPVFGIIFTKFPIWPKQPEILYDAFQIGSKYDLKRVYSDHLKLHFITIPDRKDDPERCLHDTELRQWLKILNYPNMTSEEEMTTLATENPLIGEAYERTKNIMADSQVQYYMEARLKHALDEATRRREAYTRGRGEGMEEGMEVGRAEGIEVGRAEGIEVGRAEGIEVGREEGIELGMVRQQRTSIQTMLTKRFGPVDTAIEEALGGKTDMDELERLLFTAATCGSLDEFKARL